MTDDATNPQAIAAAAEAAEVERVRALLAGPLSKLFPDLSQAIAFETALPADIGLRLLTAAHHDIGGPSDD